MIKKYKLSPYQKRRKQRKIMLDLAFGIFILGFSIVALSKTLPLNAFTNFLFHIKQNILTGYIQIKSVVIVILVIVVVFCSFRIRYIIVESRRFIINSSGYLKSLLFYQHRLVAEQCLGRKLRPGEEVHHINGSRTNNRPSNLCVLMREDHRAFHIALKEEKQIRGHYPSIAEQKNVLSEQYGGILLMAKNQPHRK